MLVAVGFGGFIGVIEAEFSFAGGFVAAMTFEACVGEDRADVSVELDLVRVRRGGERGRG